MRIDLQERVRAGPRRAVSEGKTLGRPSIAADVEQRGDGVADFIRDVMIADWDAYRDELIAFWKSGEYTSREIFPDSLPWLWVMRQS